MNDAIHVGKKLVLCTTVFINALGKKKPTAEVYPRTPIGIIAYR